MRHRSHNSHQRQGHPPRRPARPDSDGQARWSWRAMRSRWPASARGAAPTSTRPEAGGRDRLLM